MKRLHASWILLMVIIGLLGLLGSCFNQMSGDVSFVPKASLVYPPASDPDLIGEQGSPLMVPLYAGQSTDVGTVEVWLADESLWIRFTTTWSLVETHFDVVTDPKLFPQTNKGNPKPGQFKYKAAHDPGTSIYEFCVPIPEDDILYFAAHAEVEKWIDGAPVREESAWADGYDFAGANWATYFAGEKPSDPFAWMYGYWVSDACTRPDSVYLEIREDGTWWWWINYDGSGGIDDSGTWYIEDGSLIIVMDGMEVPTEVIKLSDDELIFIMMGMEEHWYRKGTEPCWVFDLPPVVIPVSSEWTVRTFSDDEVHLFTFQAPASGAYEISWKQAGDPNLPVFTAEIKVLAYRSDQETQIFWQDMSGYFFPVPVQMDTDELIYIIVDDDPGNYGIRVLQLAP